MFKRFDNLIRWVVGGDSFVRAYHSVLRNKGSAGMDGVKTEDLPRYLTHHWEQTKSELEQGTYQPQLVISPLLSNILLHELDVELEKRGHCFVRFADDCSIFLTSILTFLGNV